jgi:hypothetical protein
MSYAVRDQRFAFEGRGGLVRFDDGERRGVLDWEMLGDNGPSIGYTYGEEWPERPIVVSLSEVVLLAPRTDRPG